jgi:hypothetical protein
MLISAGMKFRNTSSGMVYQPILSTNNRKTVTTLFTTKRACQQTCANVIEMEKGVIIYKVKGGTRASSRQAKEVLQVMWTTKEMYQNICALKCSTGI